MKDHFNKVLKVGDKVAVIFNSHGLADGVITKITAKRITVGVKVTYSSIARGSWTETEFRYPKRNQIVRAQ